MYTSLQAFDDHFVSRSLASSSWRGQYGKHELSDEISAKLLAGDRFGLSTAEGEVLRDAYMDAVAERYPNQGTFYFPDLGDSEERFYGEQRGDKEASSGVEERVLSSEAGQPSDDAGGIGGEDGDHEGDAGFRPRSAGAVQGRGEGKGRSEAEAREGITQSSRSGETKAAQEPEFPVPPRYRQAAEQIRRVVQDANQPGNAKTFTNYADVSPWLQNEAQKAGLDLEHFP